MTDIVPEDHQREDKIRLLLRQHDLDFTSNAQGGYMIVDHGTDLPYNESWSNLTLEELEGWADELSHWRRNRRVNTKI